ncbi:hypothetical protein [Pedobacter alpinus]|uniref:Outer membrane protein n=1 Tax=Pedobacter alpinus TaxID=1590643 RepID=A0ABW5TQA9_9SPHI
MKKLLLLTLFAVSVSLSGMAQSSYKNSIGLGLDFGNGATLAGPSFKHFFNANSAGQAELLFGGNTTRLQAFYQYHQSIKGAQGLNWYIGGGPGFDFHDHGRNNDHTSFLLIPMAGLDFKIPGAPIAMNFDWRPTAFIGDHSHFEGGRFGFGFRFAF